MLVPIIIIIVVSILGNKLIPKYKHDKKMQSELYRQYNEKLKTLETLRKTQILLSNAQSLSNKISDSSKDMFKNSNSDKISQGTSDLFKNANSNKISQGTKDLFKK